MAGLPFVKMQGLGNDFVIVDLRHGEPAPTPNDPAIAQRLCDRHFGIGADGVLAILPPSQKSRADARMRVLNADGSEAEMCGNGLRCVARFLWEHDPEVRRRAEPKLQIETGAGVLSCTVALSAAERVESVEIGMGPARFRRGEIPMAGPAGDTAVEQPLSIDDRMFPFTAVSMGNPHAVIFVPGGEEPLRPLAERYGPLIERHPLFPRRTNVEFARMKGQAGEGEGGEIELLVWERGCGITLACGTGACATAAAACMTGRSREGRTLRVHLLGGTLQIQVVPGYGNVLMRGPAVEVFRGTVDL